MCQDLLDEVNFNVYIANPLYDNYKSGREIELNE